MKLSYKPKKTTAKENFYSTPFSQNIWKLSDIPQRPRNYSSLDNQSKLKSWKWLRIHSCKTVLNKTERALRFSALERYPLVSFRTDKELQQRNNVQKTANPKLDSNFWCHIKTVEIKNLSASRNFCNTQKTLLDYKGTPKDKEARLCALIHNAPTPLLYIFDLKVFTKLLQVTYSSKIIGVWGQKVKNN